MIRQDDPRFSDDPRIKEFACVVFVYLFIANKISGIQLGISEIKTLIERFESNGWIDREFTVMQPDRILQYCGVKAEPVKAEAAGYICQPGEYELCMWGYRDSTGHWWEHAIYGDGRGGQGYDPLGRSHCGKYGTIVAKRIVKVIEEAV